MSRIFKFSVFFIACITFGLSAQAITVQENLARARELVDLGNTHELTRLLDANDGLATAYMQGGNTLLHYAAQRNDSKACNVLMRSYINYKMPNQFGKSPALVAAEYGAIDAFNAIATHAASSDDSITNHANVNDGSTAFIVAVKHNQRAFIEMLQGRHDFDPTIRDIDGNSALMHAVLQNNVDLVDYLLKHFVRLIDITNNVGTSPLLLAVRSGNQQIVKLLISYGVKNGVFRSIDEIGFHPNTSTKAQLAALFETVQAATVEPMDESGELPFAQRSEIIPSDKSEIVVSRGKRATVNRKKLLSLEVDVEEAEKLLEETGSVVLLTPSVTDSVAGARGTPKIARKEASERAGASSHSSAGGAGGGGGDEREEFDEEEYDENDPDLVHNYFSEEWSRSEEREEDNDDNSLEDEDVENEGRGKKRKKPEKAKRLVTFASTRDKKFTLTKNSITQELLESLNIEILLRDPLIKSMDYAKNEYYYPEAWLKLARHYLAQAAQDQNDVQARVCAHLWLLRFNQDRFIKERPLPADYSTFSEALSLLTEGHRNGWFGIISNDQAGKTSKKREMFGASIADQRLLDPITNRHIDKSKLPARVLAPKATYSDRFRVRRVSAAKELTQELLNYLRITTSLQNLKHSVDQKHEFFSDSESWLKLAEYYLAKYAIDSDDKTAIERAYTWLSRFMADKFKDGANIEPAHRVHFKKSLSWLSYGCDNNWFGNRYWAGRAKNACLAFGGVISDQELIKSLEELKKQHREFIHK